MREWLEIEKKHVFSTESKDQYSNWKREEIIPYIRRADPSLALVLYAKVLLFVTIL
jgi:hypothetical protein